MDIIVSCGMQNSWCEFIQDRLEGMGVKAPKPAPRTDSSAYDLIAKMCISLPKSEKETNHYQPAQLGRAWEVAASDLFVANVETPVWGWSDPRNIHLLNFWSDFDPGCKFILAYGSPAESLAIALRQDTLTISELEESISDWAYYHQALLEFFHSNRERSILTHIGAFERRSAPVLEMLKNRFEIEVGTARTSKWLQKSPLREMIARYAIADYRAENELLFELDNSADIPMIRDNKKASLHVVTAAKELQELTTAATHSEHLISALDFQEHQNTELTQQIETIKQELNEVSVLAGFKDTRIGSLEAALKEARHKLQDEQAKHQKLLQQEIDQHRAVLDYELQQKELLSHQLQSLTSRPNPNEIHLTNRIEEENKLLGLQLSQVQEELDHYFKKYQTLQNKENDKLFESTSVEAAAISSEYVENLNIDMRGFVNGNGWHSAEPQGRWAGAQETCSVSLPALQSRAYLLEAKVVDAISLDHFMETQLEVDGQPVDLRYVILSDMGGNLAALRRLKARLQKTEKPFPAKLVAQIPSGLVNGNAAEHTLTFKFPKPVSPATKGESDARNLSICVETISLSCL